MIKQPASKAWFAKYGLPKNLGPKKIVASKMSSNGCLKKAEVGEKQHTGKSDFQKAIGKLTKSHSFKKDFENWDEN